MNVVDLRDNLAEIFNKLKKEEIEPEQAAQLTNCAGKIISTLRAEMEYADRLDKKPDIEFME